MAENRYPKFADAIQRRLRHYEMTSRDLADALGCNFSAVFQWKLGRILPTPERLTQLVKYFDAPILAEIALEYRRRTCVECGAVFYQVARGTTRRYCTHDCASAARRAEATHWVGILTSERDKAIARQNEMTQTIARHCKRCTEAECWDPSCEMRPFSPLPLSREAQKESA